MVAAIKQVVTVGTGGKIEIPSSDLHPGTRAEVIVLVEDEPRARQESAPARLASFRALQSSLGLDQAKADAWVEQIRAIRNWDRSSHDPA